MKSEGTSKKKLKKALKTSTAVVLLTTAVLSVIYRLPLCFDSQNPAALAAAAFTLTNGEYVRIGAFAVSHAAMMEVVLMLSGASAGHTNWIVFVLGNVLVCGLEGLVVGIQVLRLEYYEMFSRFYKGTGREFKPFHSQSDRK